ncbi:MAG: MATE family efflux transporter [Planctomycetota bacterium]|nr:MAG: MATE family efflux transporter [Planctomycetota bacterium]
MPEVPPARPRSWLADIWSVLRGAQHDYTGGELSRAIVLLAVPMVLEMAMESVFAIVDVFFVAKLGDDAVAAVGLTESMLTIVYAFAIGISMAATALIARRIGERNVEGAVRAATQAVAIGVIAGALIGLPCFVFAEDLLRLMGASDAVIAGGSGYTRAILGCNFAVFLLFLNNAVFRGAGDPVLAMRALWLANGINVILDPCLIFGWGPFPELGVTGAGIATVIGRSVGVLYQIYMLRAGAGRIALRGPGFRFVPRIALEILRLSVGGVSQFLIATASWVVLMRIVAPFGDQAVAGYTIAIRIVVFALLPSWGLSNAAATLVGQNLGAGRPDRAERATWLTGLYNMAFLGLVTIVFLLFAPQIVSLFTSKPETAEVAVTALRTLSYGYVFYAWGMVLPQAFNGAGDTMTPTYINFFCYWVLEIPLAYVLARTAGYGPSGVFWSVCIAEATMAVAAAVVFRRGKWKTVQVAADTSPPAH